MSDITLSNELVSRADAPAAPTPGYWKSVGQRLLRDKTTVFVTLVLIGILFITLGAPPGHPVRPLCRERARPPQADRHRRPLAGHR